MEYMLRLLMKVSHRFHHHGLKRELQKNWCTQFADDMCMKHSYCVYICWMYVYKVDYSLFIYLSENNAVFLLPHDESSLGNISINKTYGCFRLFELFTRGLL